MILTSLLFYDEVIIVLYNYTTVKVRLFCLLYCSLNFMYFLWARHDHNKIAPCGMIKVFWIELNWFWIELNWNTHSITQQHTHTHTHIRARAHSHSHSRTERERVVVEVVVVVVVVRERETDRQRDRQRQRQRQRESSAGDNYHLPKGIIGKGKRWI